MGTFFRIASVGTVASAAAVLAYTNLYPYFREIYYCNYKIDEADGYEVYKIDKAFSKLRNLESGSILRQTLLSDTLQQLKFKKTKLGGTLLHIMQSGADNPDSFVGAYAADPESYKTFEPLFNKIFERIFKFEAKSSQPKTDFGDNRLIELTDMDPNKEHVVSTNIRCNRSIKGYPFHPLLNDDDYLIIEEKIKMALEKFRKDPTLEGIYRSIEDLDKNKTLPIKINFNKDNRFLKSAGARNHWPRGRGIFINNQNTFFLELNNEDHLSFTSSRNDGKLKEALDPLVKAVNTLEDKIQYARDNRLGWLTFSPSNIGNGIRVFVVVKLPTLGANPDFLRICDELNLRPLYPEEYPNSENLDASAVSLTNKCTLGFTEFESIKQIHDGVKKLIQLEKDSNKT